MSPSDLICVCMKPVWRTDVPLRLDAGGHGPRPGEALQVPNAADLAALQLALQLRDAAALAAGPLRVLALTVGPPAAEAVLREALAAGADAVLRVWGAAWPAQTPAVDATAAVTRAHAAAAAEVLRQRRPALVLTGERSADTAHECFGALLAAALGAAFAHRVTALRPQGGGWEATVRLERGYGQPLRLEPPAVATVSAQLPRPPQASLPAWLASRAAAVPLAEVSGAPPGAGQTALRIPRPRVKHVPAPDRALSAEQRIQALVSLEAGGGGAMLVDGPPQAQAEAVLKLLRERGYV